MPGKTVRAIHDAVAQGHVPLPIHGCAAHPAVDTVTRGIGSLLIDRIDAVRTPHLVPANACHTRRRLDRLVGYKRFIRAEVTIGETVGWALTVGENVQILSRVGDARLRQAVT